MDWMGVKGEPLTILQKMQAAAMIRGVGCGRFGVWGVGGLL